MAAEEYIDIYTQDMVFTGLTIPRKDAFLKEGQYMLYAEYAHMGLAKSRTRYNAFLDPKCDGRKEKMGKAVTHTYLVWTEKGRKFIHDLAHRFWELAELYEVKNLG